METLTRELWRAQDRHVGIASACSPRCTRCSRPRRRCTPGSFVDVAASFVVDDVTDVDSDRRAARFFADRAGVGEIVAEHRVDPSAATWRFVAADYRDPLPLEDASVDLLVSLYAGLVSDHCTRYLRPGGLLLANASHGDAAVVALGDGYELAAAVTTRGGRYRLRRDDLGRYLRPRDPEAADVRAVRARGRGIAYTTPAFAYVFRRSTHVG